MYCNYLKQQSVFDASKTLNDNSFRLHEPYTLKHSYTMGGKLEVKIVLNKLLALYVCFFDRGCPIFR